MKIVVLTHLEREKSKKHDLVVDQVRAVDSLLLGLSD